MASALRKTAKAVCGSMLTAAGKSIIVSLLKVNDSLIRDSLVRRMMFNDTSLAAIIKGRCIGTGYRRLSTSAPKLSGLHRAFFTDSIADTAVLK
ncbi:hypothetical protein E2562_024142, partial [Oryza meyeriana var. granulata]